MRLLVIRHAIAMDRKDFRSHALLNARDSGVDPEKLAGDDFRPLTGDGAKKMRRNARGLVKLSERPDLLVMSPLVRALQTAEIVNEAWDMALPAVVCEELRPGTAPSAFCQWVKSQDRIENPDALVAIVGHEPHLSSLVSWLLGGQTKSLIELKKGGACLLDFPTSFGKASGRLLWLAPPSILRICK